MSELMTDSELAAYNLTRRQIESLKKEWGCATDRDVIVRAMATALVAAKRADDESGKTVHH